MRFFVFIALLLAFTAPATAQSTNTTEAPNASSGTYVSQAVEIVDSGYNKSSGQAYIVLRSSEAVTVTVSDGGSLSKGSGEIASRTVVLDRNERTRVVVDATQVSGRVALVIDTPDVLYGHVIEPSDNVVGGEYTARDAQITALSGFSIVSIVSIIMVVRYLAGTTHEPERIA